MYVFEDAWVRYDNHNVIWWANLSSDAFYSSTNGNVYKIRNTGNATDFRDDASAISCEWTTRAEDFGYAATRKTIHGVTIECQLDDTDITGATASSSVDMSDTFTSMGTITVSQSTNAYTPVVLEIQNRKCSNIRVKLAHSVKDEELQIVGISYDVEPHSTLGIKQVGELSS